MELSRPRKKDPCSYDEELGIYIHRFDMASSVCRCGFQKVEKPTMGRFNPFGRRPKDEEDSEAQERDTSQYDERDSSSQNLRVQELVEKA